MEEEVSLEPSVCNMSYHTVVERFIDTLGYDEDLDEQVKQYIITQFFSGEAYVPVIRENSAKIKTTTKLKKGASGQIILQTLTDGRKRLVKKLIALPEEAFYEALVQFYLHSFDPVHINPYYAIRRAPGTTSGTDESTFLIHMGKLDFTLNEHLKKMNTTELTDKLFISIVIPVYEALNKLYTCGLQYHGDLHGGNIMYLEGDFPHVPKIIDFGRCEVKIGGIPIRPTYNVVSRYDIITLLANLYSKYKNDWLSTMLGSLKDYLEDEEEGFRWQDCYFLDFEEPYLKVEVNRIYDSLQLSDFDAYRASTAEAAPSIDRDTTFLQRSVLRETILPNITPTEKLTAGLEAWATRKLEEGEEGSAAASYPPYVPRSAAARYGSAAASYPPSGSSSAAASSGSEAVGTHMANKFLRGDEEVEEVEMLGGRRRRRKTRRRKTQRRKTQRRATRRRKTQRR
jgi:hypothetical protein